MLANQITAWRLQQWRKTFARLRFHAYLVQLNFRLYPLQRCWRFFFRFVTSLRKLLFLKVLGCPLVKLLVQHLLQINQLVQLLMTCLFDFLWIEWVDCAVLLIWLQRFWVRLLHAATTVLSYRSVCKTTILLFWMHWFSCKSGWVFVASFSWFWLAFVQVKWVDHKLKRLAVTVDRRSLLHHVWVIIVQNRLRAFLLVALVKNRISTIHNHVVYGCFCKWFVSSTVLAWNIVLTNLTDHWVRLRFLKGNRI